MIIIRNRLMKLTNRMVFNDAIYQAMKKEAKRNRKISVNSNEIFISHVR